MADPKEDIGPSAAESTVALNPVVGINPQEILNAAGIVLRTAGEQPVLFGKHLLSFNRELLDILSGNSELAPAPKDRRFHDRAWGENIFYKTGLQSWLALRKELNAWVDDTSLSAKDKVRAQFVLNLVGDALAPTNMLLGNPSALKRLVETGGMSLLKGAQNFLDDVVNNGGLPKRVDDRPFKLGKNIATSEGAVVFRNDIFELIQYKPLTETVKEVPILSVPPQINKFYISDISPEKSMFRHLLSRGIQVFAMSWRNPTKEHAHWGLENYVRAIYEAIEATLSITGQKQLNISGACSGGITTAALMSHMAANDDDRVRGLTLMVNVLDSSPDDSELGVFISERTIKWAQERSRKQGILAGDDLARTFAWLRPNDLIWNYVVNNYLHGEDPPPFDILVWNDDSTNLPAQLHHDYLEHYMTKPFANPGKVDFMDHKIDLSKVKNDTFMVAGVTDHITPWRACYRTTQLLGGEIDFILSNSGHIQSMLNPPGNPKAKYFVGQDYKPNPEEWFKNSEEIGGSWWDRWADWLSERGGDDKPSPKQLGSNRFVAGDAAPGTYVID